MQSEYKGKANSALGVFILALVFLFETSVAHRARPSLASPFVWGVLGLVVITALALFVCFRVKDRKARRQSLRQREAGLAPKKLPLPEDVASALRTAAAAVPSRAAASRRWR